MRQQSLISRFAVLAVGTGLALGLVACSKSDESSSSSTTTTAASSPSTTAAQVNCTELQSALSNVSSIVSQVGAQGGSVNLEQFDAAVAQMKEDVATISAQLQLANAPAQAAQLYTQRNEALIGLLEQFGQTKNNEQFQTGFAQYQTPEYTEAATEVGTALKAQCPDLTD